MQSLRKCSTDILLFQQQEKKTRSTFNSGCVSISQRTAKLCVYPETGRSCHWHGCVYGSKQWLLPGPPAAAASLDGERCLLGRKGCGQLFRNFFVCCRPYINTALCNLKINSTTKLPHFQEILGETQESYQSCSLITPWKCSGVQQSRGHVLY